MDISALLSDSAQDFIRKNQDSEPAELMLTGKPSVMVPSPNVAEDHQTKNAMALVEREAAVMVEDNKAREHMIAAAIEILENKAQCKKLSENIEAMAHPNASQEIANEIIKMVA